MNHPADSSESSDYEGIRNPSSRSSTGPVVLNPRYTTSHATDMNPLRSSNTTSYGTATRYPRSRSSPIANGFSTNGSSNPGASNTVIGDCIVPTFLNEPDSDLCFEPEAIDPFYMTPNLGDFNPLIPNWSPLHPSLQATSSVHDNYSTDVTTWTTSAIPWHETSAECSVKGVSAGPLPPSDVTDNQADFKISTSASRCYD
jgi:hypothetical protein